MRKGTIILVFLALILESFLLPVFAAENDALSMVIFPRRNVKVTHRMFQPMATYLSEALQRKVKLHTPKDFNAFSNVLKSGQYDLVHLNQYHYINANDNHGSLAILKNVEFGSPYMRGVIMVREDSGLETIEDLRGKKILFGGGPSAMQSYIIPTWLLRNAGLKKGDYQEVFAKNPMNALISTYHRQADAAGVGNVVIRLNVVKNAVDATKMKVLIAGPELPQLVWAVNKTMPEQLRESIQEILSSMDTHPAGQGILNQAQLTALQVTVNEEYEQYRSIIEYVQEDALEGKTQ